MRCSRSTALRLSLGAILALAACSSATPPTTGQAQRAPARPSFVTMDDRAQANAGLVVEAVRPTTKSEQLVAPGLLAVDEMRTARVGSLQEGLVLETQAQVGDHVATQSLLATMHGHAVHDAWAGYRKAMAARRHADNELAYAVEAHERAKRLYADKAVSLQELQRAELERAAATESLDVSKAEVIRSIEELKHTGVEASPSPSEETQQGTDEASEQIAVRSPIGGIVLERLVTPGTTVTPGSPMFVLSDLSTLWAIAEIDESLLSRVEVGRPVDVTVAAYPGEHFAGTVTFIADTVNPKTRRITVRCTVPNPDRRLKPEMFATIALGEGPSRPVTVLPIDAVQTLDGNTVVFVEETKGRFVATPVQVASTNNATVEITSGLSEGARVVTRGSFVLKSELLKAAAAEH